MAMLDYQQRRPPGSVLHERREDRRSAAARHAPGKSDRRFWNRLYQQKDDGTFADVTEKAGLSGAADSAYGMGVAVGDYDNDGFADLYVTNYGGNRLYRNKRRWHVRRRDRQRRRRCRRVECQRRVLRLRQRRQPGSVRHPLSRRGPSRATAIAGRRSRATAPTATRTISTARRISCIATTGRARSPTCRRRLASLRAPGKGLGVAFADYDRDGFVDVYVANDSVQCFLYHNNRDGTFTEVGLLAGVGFNEDGKTFAGMGVDFADYDNDGHADIIVTDLSNERYMLFRQSGDGSFRDATNLTGVGGATLPFSGWSTRFFDYDNDGWKDLFVAQGHVMDTIEKTSPNLKYLQPPLLLRNEKGRFVRVLAGRRVSRRTGPAVAPRSAIWTTTGIPTSWSATSGRRPTCCGTTAAIAATGWAYERQARDRIVTGSAARSKS